MMKRWIIAVMGTLLHLCLGTVYAWSYFQKPLVENYHWSNVQVAWAFSLAICFLGLAAAWGGMQLPKFGPRKLAIAGGLLFGAGYLLASFALQAESLTLLYIGYGVVGGTGLGLGYVTPVATVARWFPDKKGLATGMVVMGFGLGALLMSKVLAPVLLAFTHGDMVYLFKLLGVIFLIVPAGVALFLYNPPADFRAPGAAAVAPASAAPAQAQAGQPSVMQRLCSRQFTMMWIVFFCNIVAGISIISFQSPLLQELYQRLNPGLAKPTLVAYGATLIAVSSLFNGLGRFFWGWISDRIGRARTFRIMLGSQAAAFALLCGTGHPWIFGALVCYILLCYGGGFGTMPSFVLDVFGRKLMAVMYGCILTAWSVAGIVGPQIVASLKDHNAETASLLAFTASAILLTIGLALAFALNDKAQATEA